MKSWHVDVRFRTAKPFKEDAAFDLIEALAENSAAVSIERDCQGGTVSLSIDGSATVIDALGAASDVVRKATKKLLGAIDIIGLDGMTEEVFLEKLNQPAIPPVVGYAEIAELAGVTRQRARQFTVSRGFPQPVITTGQGPLMDRAAVVSWLSGRKATAGRPRKEQASV
jgi:hypothetical protein